MFFFGKKKEEIIPEGISQEQLMEEKQKLADELIEAKLCSFCNKAGIDRASLSGDDLFVDLLNKVIEEKNQLKANVKSLGNSPAGHYQVDKSEPMNFNQAYELVRKANPTLSAQQARQLAAEKYSKLYRGGR